MGWFDKRRRVEIWDQPIQWPIGDIEAAKKIREICSAAAGSADKAAASAGRPDRKRKSEAARYERAARAAMEIALKMSDELMRDTAVRQIVDLCMTADDVRTARILFRAIQAVSIKDDVLNDHPSLRE